MLDKTEHNQTSKMPNKAERWDELARGASYPFIKNQLNLGTVEPCQAARFLYQHLGWFDAHSYLCELGGLTGTEIDKLMREIEEEFHEPNTITVEFPEMPWTDVITTATVTTANTDEGTFWLNPQDSPIVYTERYGHCTG